MSYKRTRLPEHLTDKQILSMFKNLEKETVLVDCPEIFGHYLRAAHKVLYEYQENGRKLTPSNYVAVLNILNQIEDAFIETEVDKFHISTEIVEKGNDSTEEYFISISNISKFLAFLGEGDSIVLKPRGYESLFGYDRHGEDGVIECIITKITEKKIIFKPFDKSGKIDIQQKYKMKFKKDRTVVRMEQEALTQIESQTILKTLFPSYDHLELPQLSCKSFEWFNESICENNEQRQAVINIVNGTAYPAPYILFGPPGTGKTTTVVEAIAQIYKQKPSARILVAATSNAASDEVAIRLLNLGYIQETDMYRWYSYTQFKKVDDLDERLVEISNLKGGEHTYPEIDELENCRIIIVTLITSGRLALKHMSKKFFDYIFIDEAGSATESSAIIPLAGLLTHDHNFIKRTLVVLSGDPLQLGPVVKSPHAEKFGLGISLLERLMKRDIYQPNLYTDKHNKAVFTKLKQNYRSHKDIIHISNTLFYDGELVSIADSTRTNWAQNWFKLPNKKIPIIFHATIGKSERDECTFSMFNMDEITEISYYVNQIITKGINNRDIDPKEIGIISPYKKQCEMIKNKIRWMNKDGLIEVGTVEIFQGQEKDVIILSTVRSNTNTVGFLDNPKRLNVALSRARALLIIVGNPNTLEKDKHWRQVIQFCKHHSTFSDSNNRQKSRKPRGKNSRVIVNSKLFSCGSLSELKGIARQDQIKKKGTKTSVPATKVPIKLSSAELDLCDKLSKMKVNKAKSSLPPEKNESEVFPVAGAFSRTRPKISSIKQSETNSNNTNRPYHHNPIIAVSASTGPKCVPMTSTISKPGTVLGANDGLNRVKPTSRAITSRPYAADSLNADKKRPVSVSIGLPSIPKTNTASKSRTALELDQKARLNINGFNRVESSSTIRPIIEHAYELRETYTEPPPSYSSIYQQHSYRNNYLSTTQSSSRYDYVRQPHTQKPEPKSLLKTIGNFFSKLFS